MPYIKQEDRDKILKDNLLDITKIETAGEIQYAIAVILKKYLERKPLRYQTCNDIMGALAGAQMEFYRKVVSKYEDDKIKQNGDV